MTVLQINAVYNLSSTGRTTTELHKALLEKGINSYVAYSKTNCTEDKNIYHIGSGFDVKLHGLMSRISGEQGYYSKYATVKLLKYIDSIKPDIVHLRNLHGNYINLPMLLKYLAEKKIAVVITFHDFWFVTGKCVHFAAAKCCKWQGECGKCPNLKDGNPTWFFDRTEKLLNDKKKLLGNLNRLALVGVSQWVTDEVNKSPIAKKATVVKRIYNWIDFNKFYPRSTENIKTKYKLNGKFVVAGISSVWSERKGLTSFIRLAESMQEIKIILVGKMPENVNLPENIICVGSTNSTDELAEIYSAADVFVTFSLEETFGKVSAEALSCGTPVICYNSTANPEIVGDGCGYSVEKNNLGKVCEAISLIRENGKAFYSEKCLKFAKMNFDKDTLINNYVDLYKNLLL